MSHSGAGALVNWIGDYAQDQQQDPLRLKKKKKTTGEFLMLVYDYDTEKKTCVDG